MTKSLIFAACAAALAAGCASTAQEAATPPVVYTVVQADARVPFASGIRNYRVGKDAEKSLLLEGSNGRWYRATLDSICRRQLPWENAIATENGATNTLDKFSFVVVDGRRCRIETLDEIADPDHPPAAAPAS